MANYNFEELESVVAQWARDSQQQGIIAQEIGEIVPEAVSFGIDTEPANITCVANGTEMLRVAKDGFYVRGQKVPVDDKEAEMVYKAFKEFLVWAELGRS